jgi:microcystin degradation protein MlrC
MWISDAGDNTTAGGTGDTTTVLHAVLADPRLAGTRVLIAPLVDRASVEAAVEVGVGGEIDRAIGAVVDARDAGRVPGPWRVARLIEGAYAGEGIVAALLERAGPGGADVSVLVQTQRSKFTPLDDTTIKGRRMPGNAWIDPSGWDVVVVKNGYFFPAQLDRAATAFLATTPGGTDLDPERLGFRRIRRPVFPLDRTFDPDLTPRLLGAAR